MTECLPYFYSRPRVGGDILDALNGHAYNDISTHAPAWGATLEFVCRLVADIISTHAPAWGRQQLEAVLGVLIVISTHAPAWEATVESRLAQMLEAFLLTPPRGGRLRLGHDAGSLLLISTHAPAWGRPAYSPGTCWPSNFYSRPRVGGDESELRRQLHRRISTHASAWGAT